MAAQEMNQKERKTALDPKFSEPVCSPAINLLDSDAA
jgi:hypothetical protein